MKIKGQKCRYCKEPAKIYRFISKGRFEFVCGSKGCDEKSLENCGFYVKVKTGGEKENGRKIEVSYNRRSGKGS